MLLTLRLPELPAGSVARPPGTAMRTVELPGGRAHLFYPHPDELAVMVEADPEGRPFPERGARPRTELLAAAAGGLLPTALGGDGGEPHAVEVRFPALASPEGEAAFTRLFAPLGYTIKATLLPLDRLRPWAPGSWYFSLVLRGRHRVEDVASHLDVLLRLLDTGEEPHDAAAGAARWNAARHWLESHPKRQMLERRIVLGGFGMDRHGPRHETVVAALKESGARRVLDLGCGTGALLRRLLEEPQFTEVVGVEVGQRALAEAEAALPAGGRARVLHGSLVYRDARLAGFDAAAVVEVIEHLDPPQLAAFEDALWAAARPGTIVLTTPNADYNTLFEYHRGGALRHPDHRFEWTRAEFQAWARAVAARHGYAVRFGAVGVEAPGVGALTQVAVFTRLPGPPPAPADAAALASAGWPCLEDVAGERTVSTRLGTVHVTADESAAALEPISRFAVDPRWLVYLPATTPAAETQAGTGAREHPSAALAYYRARGVERVALQELHAGTRVAVVVCRDAGAARNRFGAAAGETGAVYTAVGRRWFATREAEEEFLERVRGALDAGGLWRELGTEWVALEGVMGPGSPLMREVDPGDRPVIALYWGAAAVELATLAAEEEVLARPAAEDASAAALLARVRARAAAVCVYEDAVRRLCVPAYAPGDLRLAHVRVLAGEGAVYAARDPRWHLDRLAAPVAAAPHTLLETEQAVIDLADPASEETAQAWWEAAVARGGRGVVVRPMGSATDGLMAPALKCRGDAALLLAHGPEHALPGHREQARGPGLDEACSRAAREWALSLEALEGFVHGEPAARVHACFFAALGVKLGGRP